jgi:hypothetical protein
MHLLECWRFGCVLVSGVGYGQLVHLRQRWPVGGVCVAGVGHGEYGVLGEACRAVGGVRVACLGYYQLMHLRERWAVGALGVACLIYGKLVRLRERGPVSALGVVSLCYHQCDAAGTLGPKGHRDKFGVFMRRPYELCVVGCEWRPYYDYSKAVNVQHLNEPLLEAFADCE